MNRAAELGLYVEEFASPYVEGEGKSRVVGLPDKSRTRPPLVRLAFIRYWDRHSFGASQKSEIKTSASAPYDGFISKARRPRSRAFFSKPTACGEYVSTCLKSSLTLAGNLNGHRDANNFVGFPTLRQIY